MSTRSSIKYSREDGKPGYHLWEDCFEVMADPEGADVVLELSGIHGELSTGGEVMIVLPREMARELGLLPPKEQS